MINIVKKNLHLNKLEKSTVLSAITGLTLTIGVCNVYWILDHLGIHLATGVVRELIDAIAKGTGLASAFAAIAGVTLPAWAVAAVAAFGATAA